MAINLSNEALWLHSLDNIAVESTREAKEGRGRASHGGVLVWQAGKNLGCRKKLHKTELAGKRWLLAQPMFL